MQNESRMVQDKHREKQRRWVAKKKIKEPIAGTSLELKKNKKKNLESPQRGAIYS